MKKRILALLLAVAVMLGIPFASFASESSEGYAKEAMTHLANLGIISSDLTEDGYMTRGQFAQAVYNLCGNGTVLSRSYSFYDLAPGHTNYDALQFCVQMGYMNGYSDGYIRPDNVITYMEGMTVIARMLNYTDYAVTHGDYTVGYYTTAKNLGILKDTEMTASNDAMNNGSASVLLYNSMRCGANELYSINPIYYEYITRDKIFAYDKLGLNYATGVMTSNGYTDVTGNGQYGKYTVAIDGNILSLRDTSDECRFLIGQSVSVFYDDDMNVVSVSSQYSKNNTLTITKQQYGKKSGSHIQYNVDNKTLNASISSETLYFKNGDGALDLESTGFFSADYADLYLVDNDDDETYEYVFVNIYTPMVVYSMDSSGIVTSLNGNNQTDFGDEDKAVGIYNTKGEKITYEDIKVGQTVSVIEDTDFIYAIAYDGSASGTLNIIDEYSIKLDSLTVNVENGTAGFFKNITIGTYIDAYFDHAGRLVYVATSIGSDANALYGYIVDCEYKNNFDKTIKLKIFNNYESMEILEFNDRFTIDGTNYRLSNMTSIPSEFMENGSLKHEVVLYEVNDSGKITSIDFAASSLGDDEDGFVKIYANQTFSLATTGVAVASKTDKTAFLDTKTRIFVIPDDLTDEYGYSVVFLSEIMSQSYMMDTYHFSKTNGFVDVAVIHGNANPIHTSNAMCVVMSVSTVLNEDGDEILKLTYYDKVAEYYGYAVDPAIIAEVKKCQPGDTVRLSLTTDSEIKNIRKVYDYKTDTLMSDCNTTITSSGSISSSTYSYATDSLYHTNCYVIYDDGAMIRVADSYIKDNTSGMLTQKGFLLSSAKVMIAEEKNGKIKVTTATKADINVGDHVVMMCRSGRVYYAVIYKD